MSDSGFPGLQCQYEIRREAALASIVAEWKTEGTMSVQLACGPARSPGDDEWISQTLDRLGVGATFVRLGSQTVRCFIGALGKSVRCGIVVLNSAASLMAAEEPALLERLTRCTRVALVALPSEKLTTAPVDLVMVVWEAVTKRIAEDLSAPAEGLQQACVFEAVPRFRVPLSLYSQRL